MKNLSVKQELYNEAVDVLLQLVNNAKRMGYDLSFEDVANLTNTKVSGKVNLLKGVDLITSTSINKTYVKSNTLFKLQIEKHMQNA